SFCLGFLVLSAATITAGRSLLATDPFYALTWHGWRFLPEALISGVWSYFSLRYARWGNPEHKWNYYGAICAATFLPLIAVFGFEDFLISHEFTKIGERWDFQIGPAGYVLYLSNLLSAGFLLVNLEYTFRAAVGTYRWRIKFIILGVATIFTARVYTSS